MGKQVDNTFTWVIKNVSSLQRIVSKSFIVGGCKWRLSADPRVMDDYMSLWLYLEFVDCEPLPSGWKRHAKSSITIVNQFSEERSHLQETQQWFTERTIGWGFPPMINLLDFSKEYDGFLVDDEVIVVAAVDVLEVLVPLDAPAKSETINDNGFRVLSSEVKKERGLFESHPDVASGFRIKNQSLKASYMNVLLNLTETLHQAPNKGISKDDLSDAETTLFDCQDSSSRSIGKQVDNTFTWVIKNVSSSLRIVSKPFIVGGCKWRLSAYPKVMDDVDYMSLSLYLDVVDCEPLPSGWKRHAKFSITIVNQFSEERSHLEETQQWFNERTTGWGFPPMINLLDFSKEHDGFLVDDEVIVVAVVDVLEVIVPLDASAKSETINYNGFRVLSSQVKKVRGLFESHPDVASGFRIKNQALKVAYMNVLLNLTETLHQALNKGITKDDLSDAETTLVNLKNVGFKLDWLEDKLDELLSKDQKKAGTTEIRTHKIEEEFTDLKQKFVDAEWNILMMIAAFNLAVLLVFVFLLKK